MDDIRPEDLKYVRSSPARTHSFVRFYNSTNVAVTLVWINYKVGEWQLFTLIN